MEVNNQENNQEVLDESKEKTLPFEKRIKDIYSGAKKSTGEAVEQFQATRTSRVGGAVARYIEQKLEAAAGKRQPLTRAQINRLVSAQKKKTTVRKAPKARLSRRKPKKPTKAQMKARMKALREMRGQPRGRVPPKARTLYRPQVRMPTSINELYKHPSLRTLLPAHERARISQMPKGLQKEAAINYLRPKLREQEVMMKRQRKAITRASNPVEQRLEVDLMSGRPRVISLSRKKEAWLS